MSEDVKVKHTIPNDPLSNLPVLPMHSPEFSPTEKMTQERMDKLDINANLDLWEEEKCLLKHILVLNKRSIAFTENERGTFRQDYFQTIKFLSLHTYPGVRNFVFSIHFVSYFSDCKTRFPHSC